MAKTRDSLSREVEKLLFERTRIFNSMKFIAKHAQHLTTEPKLENNFNAIQTKIREFNICNESFDVEVIQLY